MFWRENVTGGVFFRPLFLICFFSLFACIRSDDVQVLMKFKESLKQPNAFVFESWRPGVSPCNFSGVFCNSDQFVTGIELSSKGFLGNPDLESICQLQFLEKLDLGYNNLSGILTSDLKNCTKLRFLDISKNYFNGAVPDLSNLGELEDMRLDANGFTGQFPWKSLESLTNLTVLSIGDNPFDISSSFPLEVLKLKKLKSLFLTNCSLAGRIPTGIGNLTEMENLELSANNLTGEIPQDIVKLTKLWQLQLYQNDLHGKIPVGFGNLIQLVNFDASSNSLEGDLSEIKSLERLQNLQLYYNNFSGNIPHEFGDFKNLVGLSLYSNKFTGTLPQSVGSWSDFDFIDVSDNLLSGPIPPNMCKKGKMTEILMVNNQFTGGIPESYSTCWSLTRIRVSSNSLTGNVPAGIWGLPALDFIDLAMNQFEGPLAANIVNARSLTQLRAQNNRFSGNLPMEISKALSLVSIDLSFNQLSGTIPVNIGELKNLDSLNLQHNIFSGTIPSSLGECTSLNIINLAENSLSSKIPDTLGSLSDLNSLNLSGNHLSGQIPSSLSYLTLSLLDLSNNMLTGPVSESLSNQANNGSFIGNPGLCSQRIQYLGVCSNKSSHNIRILISCFLSGTIVLLISFAGYIFFKKKHNEQVKSFKSDSWQIKSFTRLSFCEKEILNLIKQENLIGKGGSGNVYRVVLGSGVELAVKHIWNTLSSEGNRSSTAMLMKRSGNLSEFEAEVATLSSIRHVNVVKLYCSITSEDSSLLVYEYLPNGSLWDRLHTTCDDDKLDWETRYDIAVGAAKGLEYLHHGCDRPVIHHDVKSSNILLDEFFKPRIADFGLAKIVQSNSTNPSTNLITGTHGYIAPEYAYTCKVNEKSDVYSFGVVLIELVTGKKAIEAEFGENKDIVDWVCRRMARGENIVELLDSSIPEVFKEYALKVLRIGVICTARLPALRPSMRTVVQMLLDAEPCKLIDIICQDDGTKKEVMVTDEKLKHNSV